MGEWAGRLPGQRWRAKPEAQYHSQNKLSRNTTNLNLTSTERHRKGENEKRREREGEERGELRRGGERNKHPCLLFVLSLWG